MLCIYCSWLGLGMNKFNLLHFLVAHCITKHRTQHRKEFDDGKNNKTKIEYE